MTDLRPSVQKVGRSSGCVNREETTPAHGSIDPLKRSRRVAEGLEPFQVILGDPLLLERARFVCSNHLRQPLGQLGCAVGQPGLKIPLLPGIPKEIEELVRPLLAALDEFAASPTDAELRPFDDDLLVRGAEDPEPPVLTPPLDLVAVVMAPVKQDGAARVTILDSPLEGPRKAVPLKARVLDLDLEELEQRRYDVDQLQSAPRRFGGP